MRTFVFRRWFIAEEYISFYVAFAHQNKQLSIVLLCVQLLKQWRR